MVCVRALVMIMGSVVMTHKRKYIWALEEFVFIHGLTDIEMLLPVIAAAASISGAASGVVPAITAGALMTKLPPIVFVLFIGHMVHEESTSSTPTPTPASFTRAPSTSTGATKCPWMFDQTCPKMRYWTCVGPTSAPVSHTAWEWVCATIFLPIVVVFVLCRSKKSGKTTEAQAQGKPTLDAKKKKKKVTFDDDAVTHTKARGKPTLDPKNADKVEGVEEVKKAKTVKEAQAQEKPTLDTAKMNTYISAFKESHAPTDKDQEAAKAKDGSEPDLSCKSEDHMPEKANNQADAVSVSNAGSGLLTRAESPEPEVTDDELRRLTTQDLEGLQEAGRLHIERLMMSGILCNDNDSKSESSFGSACDDIREWKDSKI